jgi:hypothetical protein
VATDDLEWLGTWYQQQCNGKWEHQTGMQLEPLRQQANAPHAGGEAAPESGTIQSGWQLRIDLRGTTAAGAPVRKLAVCAFNSPGSETAQSPWLRCTLNGFQFAGEGAEVEQLIGVFRNWIDNTPPPFEAVSVG